MQTLTMDGATAKTEIDRLLAAARETIVEVPFCWVVTPTPDGLGANARLEVLGRHAGLRRSP